VIRLMLLFLLISENCWAVCGTLSLTGIANPTVNWSETYTSQQVTFTFQRTGSGACTATASFSGGGAGSYANRSATHVQSAQKKIFYQLYKTSALSPSQILKQPPDVASANEVAEPASAFSGSATSRSASYFISVPQSTALSPTIVKAGTYTDIFQVRAYDSANIDNTYNVTLTVIVPTIARLSLVSTGGAFNQADTTESLNFGELTTGKSLSFDIRVVSNAVYDVKMSSQNNGVMKHSNPAVTTTIPYTVIVNGVESSLIGSSTTPVSVATQTQESGTSGLAHPVTFKIGNAASKVAGAYQDVVTVTISTQ
jgi:hypothetical protein